jgi:hypothetical protein
VSKLRLMSATLVVIFGATVLTVLIMQGEAVRHRAIAQAFVAEFASLKLGESNFGEAVEMARRYGGVPGDTGQGDMRCTLQKCSLVFKFENKPLNRLPFVGYVQLLGEISTKDGVVASRQLAYQRIGHSGHFNYLVLDGSTNWGNGQSYGSGNGIWRLKVDPSGIAHTILVHLGPTSAIGEKNQAYAISTFCLASLFGCGKPTAVYPHGTPYAGSAIGGRVTQN